MPTPAFLPIASSEPPRPTVEAQSYRICRTAEEFYERSKRGSLFYAVSYTLVNAIAGYYRISLWLLLPIVAFIASVWLRTSHRPPGPAADAALFRRWVRHHWLIIHSGLLLWGLILAAVGWHQAGPDSAVMVALVCTIAHSTALSHAYAMYRFQARIGIVALIGPGAVTFFLPALGLWPAAVVLSVYFVYLMGTLRQSAREFDKQIAMEFDLLETAANQQKASERLQSALQFEQQLLDVIPIPVFYKNKELVYLGCNQSYEKFLGLERDKIIGKTAFDVAPSELAQIYQRRDDQLLEHPGSQIYESEAKSVDQAKRLVIFHKATFANPEGRIDGIIGAIVDITDMRSAQKQKEEVIRDLRQALEKVKQLSGLLPICAGCKKIRDDKGYWKQIELYIREHAEVEFSHGICPDCMQRLYPGFADDPEEGASER